MCTHLDLSACSPIMFPEHDLMLQPLYLVVFLFFFFFFFFFKCKQHKNKKQTNKQTKRRPKMTAYNCHLVLTFLLEQLRFFLWTQYLALWKNFKPSCTGANFKRCALVSHLHIWKTWCTHGWHWKKMHTLKFGRKTIDSIIRMYEFLGLFVQ